MKKEDRVKGFFSELDDESDEDRKKKLMHKCLDLMQGLESRGVRSE
jgi:hypothetical protein